MNSLQGLTRLLIGCGTQGIGGRWTADPNSIRRSGTLDKAPPHESQACSGSLCGWMDLEQDASHTFGHVGGGMWQRHHMARAGDTESALWD